MAERVKIEPTNAHEKCHRHIIEGSKYPANGKLRSKIAHHQNAEGILVYAVEKLNNKCISPSVPNPP